MTNQKTKISRNDVNRNSSIRGSSYGRGGYVLQVPLDRHQDTVRLRNSIKIATWNVRSLYKVGKFDNVKREMDRMKLDIMGLCDVRWKGAGLITSGDFTMVYSGGEKHERGVGVLLNKQCSKSLKGYFFVSDRVLLIRLAGNPFDISIIQVYAPTAESSEESIETFYNEVEIARNQTKSQDIVLIQGDFNAKVGKERFENVVGPHGLGTINDRGERLREWAQYNDLVITNTWFKHHPRRRYTWKHMNGVSRNQIDYILINNRFRNSITNAKACPGADCYSDHNPVIVTLRMKLKKINKRVNRIQFDLDCLKSNNEIKEKYQVAVKNRFEIFSKIEDIDEKWLSFKEAITTAADEIIPKKRPTAKQKWMTDDILKLMDKRRGKKNKTEEYNMLNIEVIKQCKEAKQKWLEKKCQDIERSCFLNPRIMYKNIQEICHTKKRSTDGCIKTKSGELLMDNDEILNRWSEYIEELYEDNRPEEMSHSNLEGQSILQDEVRAALHKMKDGKAFGPDNIAIEMLKSLEEIGIVQLTTLLNKIYETGHIPEDLKKSIFVPIPKKPAATECDQFRTISLMSHVTKILLRIIMARIRNKTKPEIAEEQCGFVEGKGTSNAIYILRTILERALEHQKDIYLCFIDYTKAFDNVKHDKLIEILKQLDVYGKDLRIISKMYWEQLAAVRVHDEISSYKPVKRGVRQGCVLSPELFSIYSEMIMRNIVGLKGTAINGHNINNLRYADDTVLIAESPEDLQSLLNVIVEESRNMGLSLNLKKTETMVVTRKKTTPGCNISVEGKKLKQVDTFKYLGTMITSDGKCNTEIKCRITQAKTAFYRMNMVFKDRNLSIKLKLRVLQCYIEPILFYGCESWTINKEMERRLEAMEMWSLRRILRIPWNEKRKNEEILKEAEYERSVLRNVKRRKAKFFGHIMRRDGLEQLVTTGKFNGKRARGKQRRKILDDVTKFVGKDKNTDTIRSTRDRVEWRVLVANAIKQGTG